MKKVTKITLIVLAIVFVVGFFFYYRLGGFNEPEIKIVQSPAYVIAGKPYIGKMTRKEFGDLFEEAEKYVENKKISGTVAGVFYNNPEKETDSIEAFVGVILKDSTQAIPEGYSLKRIPERKVVRAHIRAHLLVSPFIYPKLEEYAKEQKQEVKHVPAIEMYPGEQEMIIEIPIK